MKRETLVSRKTRKGMPRPPGAGKKPGTLNKTTAEVREVFIEVFQRLGGVGDLVSYFCAPQHKLWWQHRKGSIYLNSYKEIHGTRPDAHRTPLSRPALEARQH